MGMNQRGFLYSLAARFRAEGIPVTTINYQVPPDRFEIFCCVMYEKSGKFRMCSFQVDPLGIPVRWVRDTVYRVRDDIEEGVRKVYLQSDLRKSYEEFKEYESIRPEEDGVIESTPS